MNWLEILGIIFIALVGLYTVPAVTYLLLRWISVLLRTQRANYEGKHVYITGGSQGLGKAIAVEFARRGAHVTVCARSRDVLEAAKAEIEAARAGQFQKIAAVPTDVTDIESVRSSLASCTAEIGRAPDIVFNCAGIAKPGFFLEQKLSDHEFTMKLNFFGALNVSHEASKLMIRENVKGSIVFVGSTLSFINFAGYSSYSSSKHALRALADVLRNELLPYNIDIRMAFPGTIFSPGFVEEQKLKPQVTKDIEGSNGQTPEAIASTILKSYDRGDFHIISDFDTDIARIATRGLSPNNNVVFDYMMLPIAWIGLSFFRMSADSAVLAAAKKTK